MTAYNAKISLASLLVPETELREEVFSLIKELAADNTNDVQVEVGAAHLESYSEHPNLRPLGATNHRDYSDEVVLQVTMRVPNYLLPKDFIEDAKENIRSQEERKLQARREELDRELEQVRQREQEIIAARQAI